MRSENSISREEGPRSVIKCLPYTAADARHATVDAKGNFHVLNSNQEVAK